MKDPHHNRLHGYEAGWLTLLLQMGVASEAELREAQGRVARAAIERMEAQKARRREERRRKRRE
ncbi:MAG: hypothetical protein LW698_03805 [Planctomycetaceae bacterium]|jgi:hypothetical protein|nr:hypothetical protein [Planctomycetaceae bacterium]